MTPGRAADDLDTAVALGVRALREAAGLDWSARAAGLEWSRRDTAVHLAGDLTGFAAQLAARVSGGYLPLLVDAAPAAAPGALIDLVEAAGRLLGAAVRAARPGDRAWHPAYAADADGFASTPPPTATAAPRSATTSSPRGAARGTPPRRCGPCAPGPSPSRA